MLISISVSKADRADIYLIVYSYRTNLQQLLSALSQSIALNRRRRSRTATPVSRLATPISTRTLAIGVGDEDEPSPALGSIGGRKTEVSKKVEQYLKDMKKPNMYIAIYYLGLCKEYGLLVNFNVLIGEDKHRVFKK